MGFYLSDHTSKLSLDKKNRTFIERPKEKMSQQEIDTILYYAYKKSLMVCIQQDIKDIHGYYPEDIVGNIDGFNEVFLTINCENIDFDLIRHVEIVEFKKWNYF